MIIIDGFLSNFESFQKYAHSAEYGLITNPEDGVGYPDISIDIPDEVTLEILRRLRSLFPFSEIYAKAIFMRLSKEGVKAPHYAHTDSIMGTHSLMLYINPGDGGTAFLRHESGMTEEPKNQDEYELWQRDMNVLDKWERIDFCPIKPNRACIFQANQFHSAEPYGGFGNSPENGRLVLTIFFTVIKWQQ